jgi:diguanylate cyclase (GGDEF)-like protein
MALALSYSRGSPNRFPVDMKQQIVELENRNAELERTNRRLKVEFERAQRLALLDPLTGLGNRRYFDSVVPSELQRAARTGKPLTLFICDVDYFKHFNDSHGHDVGDALLIEVANVLRTFCRRGGDLAIRYAGDEFALLLPDVPRHMAVRFAYNLRIAVQAISVVHRNRRIAERATLSIGGAVFRDAEPCTAATLATVADRALYRAKGAGRNRSVLALCRGSAVKA